MSDPSAAYAFGLDQGQGWRLLVAALVSFVVGSIPFGVVVGRVFFDTDIRRAGSGNIGAANALRTLGRGGAAAVLLLDVLKGFVPAATVPLLLIGGGADPVSHLARTLAGAVAGFAALLGHCFSPWLRFRGGKGVATHLGVTFALAWPAGLTFVVVWALAALSSGYSSLGSLLATVAAVPVLGAVAGAAGLEYGLGAALVIFVRHRENLLRLRTGTENRMSPFKKRKSA